MNLYWQPPGGGSYLVSEVIRYRPDGMVSIKLAGSGDKFRNLIVRRESLVASNA